MNILHLSDLHFGFEKNQSSRDKRTNCLKMMMLLIEEKKPIDYIVISGDIAWSGIKSNYEQAKTFIMDVVNKTGLDASRLILCPGNHDLNREYAKHLRVPVDFDDSVDLLNPESLEFLSKQFNDFIAFCEEVGAPKPELRKDCDSKHLIGTLTFDDAIFIILNTAWTAISDESDGKLWIGNSFWETISANTELITNKPVITIMHHPESSLNSQDRSFYDGIINTYDKVQKASTLILLGHTHETKIEPKPIKGGGYSIGCGATYSDSNYSNSFSLISLEHDKLCVCPCLFLHNEWEEKRVLEYKLAIKQAEAKEVRCIEENVYDRLIEFGFSIENCTSADFMQPGKLIWPVVPRKNITHIHQAQIELMSLMSNKYGWPVHVLISDCGSKSERLKNEGLLSFARNLNRYLCKRQVTVSKMEFLSTYFQGKNSEDPDILRDFVSISSSISKKDLEGLKNKKYNETIVNENETSPVLDYILPILQMAVVCHLGKRASNEQDASKSLIIAGNDEIKQWRYVLREMEESNLGAVLIPTLRESGKYDSWQQGVRKYLSPAELGEDIKTGNFAYWIYVLFVLLQEYNPLPPLSNYPLGKSVLSNWRENPFGDNSDINYDTLAKEAWKTFTLLIS